MIHKIESDNPFEVAFIDFWEPGDIPDWDISHKILTCLDCIKGFGIGEDRGPKKIISEQVTRWVLETYLFHLGFQK